LLESSNKSIQDFQALDGDGDGALNALELEKGLRCRCPRGEMGSFVFQEHSPKCNVFFSSNSIFYLLQDASG